MCKKKKQSIEERVNPDLYCNFREVSKNMKDYKKYLFEMVKADIDVEKMKKLREKKKKDLKAAANQVQNAAQAQQKKSKKPKPK